MRPKILRAFHKWMWIEEDEPLDVVMATTLASMFPGEPLWLFLIAPSGCLASTENVLVWDGERVEAIPIKKMYHDFRRGTIHEVLTNLDPNTITTRPAIPVKSGVKLVYELETDKGTIKASADHVFYKIDERGKLTESRLSELAPDDKILYNSWYDNKKPNSRHYNMPHMPEDAQESSESSATLPQNEHSGVPSDISRTRGHVNKYQDMELHNTLGKQDRQNRNTLSHMQSTDGEFIPQEEGWSAQQKVSFGLLQNSTEGSKTGYSTHSRTEPEKIRKSETIFPDSSRSESSTKYANEGIQRSEPGNLEYSPRENEKECSLTRSKKGKHGKTEKITERASRIDRKCSTETGQNDLSRESNRNCVKKSKCIIPVECPGKNKQWNEISRLSNYELPVNSDSMRRSILASGRQCGHRVGLQSSRGRIQCSEILGEGNPERDILIQNNLQGSTVSGNREKSVSVIQAIRRVGRKSCYDLMVPGTNNFVLESGIVVHNSGKTEIVRAFTGDQIYSLDSFTTKTMISGLVDSKDKSKTFGILPDLNGKLLIIKDLTLMLQTMRPEDSVFAYLRAAYDGELAIAHGSGHKRQYYKSKFGIIAAVTPVVDRFRNINSVLGERFISIRMSQNPTMAIKQAQRNSGHEDEMRRELSESVAEGLEYYGSIGTGGIPTLSPGDIEKTEMLGDLSARLRSGVDRDRARSVIGDPVSEIGTRLVKQLTRLGEMMKLYGAYRYPIMARVARDCIDPMRMKVIRALADCCGPINPWELHKPAMLSYGTTKEICEDLWMLKVLSKDEQGRTSVYQFTEDVLDLIISSDFLKEE